ncbi:conserved Plasmodium protein, unknown function [Plasmodium berghei]|uniref:Uncharacterized protein n=2 Tax=Plasmodium berghei TaxID=5821 RepID=A0A509AUE6_PLABA|nr:conserved Plasmodium protein, unknown function [Plasmodium berghei ANKA]CXI77794.1 conserved Plasmodium protein, unknown function [Plasmodium berghei]SCM25098.1 conserved Plasmodium protein, unknown function [Plasmodium berghei]SCN27261.1 conserved Plasmodium protein, unknown function [Plasmodium berghei]SCO61859.1 conserved Plasmodium protein, unknown function [Plasmodium berghei]SCO63687.1 conserved Plasmodium protein, unknown function [Plasmodium berghei]|eukprot:XP_034422897.1 conserved Plasmodium protein, unknown function [Plasmodium berghei ANKA]
MSSNNFNEKKRYFNMYGHITNSINLNSQVPPPPLNLHDHSPYIPQHPFDKKPGYFPNMNYPKMVNTNEYNYRNNNNNNYNNKIFMKKKKTFHKFSKNSNNECFNLKEALVNPWLPLYAKHPNFNFV